MASPVWVSSHQIQQSPGEPGLCLITHTNFQLNVRRGRLLGGERGIRTLEGLLTLTPLAGERFRPLSHLSVCSGLIEQGRIPYMIFTANKARKLVSATNFNSTMDVGVRHQKLRFYRNIYLLPISATFICYRPADRARGKCVRRFLRGVLTLPSAP
jgi:hypothetical protein